MTFKLRTITRFFIVTKISRALLLLSISVLVFQACQKGDLGPEVSPAMETPEQILETRRGSELPTPSTKLATSPVIDPINGGQEVGTARLLRQRQGLSFSLTSNALIPGHTYTVWYVIFNNPEHCGSSPCSDADFSNEDVKTDILFASGKYIRRGTAGSFRAFLREGDDSGSINGDIGLPEVGGLLDAEKAEVHLVVRSHGPAIPGKIKEQIRTFGGGCTTELPAFTEIPDEEGECADIQFAIFKA